MLVGVVFIFLRKRLRVPVAQPRPEILRELLDEYLLVLLGHVASCDDAYDLHHERHLLHGVGLGCDLFALELAVYGLSPGVHEAHELRAHRRTMRACPDGLPKLSDKIHKLYLTNEFAPDEHRYKVLPTQADRASYGTIVDGTIQAPVTSDGADTPLPRQAYEYFLKRLREDRIHGEPIDPVRLEQALVGRLEVVSITLEDADNEYRIFESLNGTGTPLAQADLIRNYFFMRSPVDEHEDLYHNVWLPMQESLGGDLDLLFRHAYMADGQFVRESDVYRAWKARLDPVPAQDLGDRMRHLAAEASNYRKLLVPREEPDALVSRGLSRLNRWGGQTSYPFLLNASTRTAKSMPGSSRRFSASSSHSWSGECLRGCTPASSTGYFCASIISCRTR